MSQTNTRPTIGILYPGEMGSSFGKLLVEAGFSVVTTLAGRSPRTHRLCGEAGLAVLDSTAAVVYSARVLISFVPPAAALEVATTVAALAERMPRRPLYVDANSISPATAEEIAATQRAAGVEFVDASVLGLASLLRQRGRLYLSGTRAQELANLFEGVIPVTVAGARPGQASALKMIISGIPKGVVALVVEVMLFARQMGLAEEVLATCNQLYPGVMEVLTRMLPTYPQHAARRAQELQEVEQTMVRNGLAPYVLPGARELTAEIATVEWANAPDQQWGLEQVMQELYRARVLQQKTARAPQTPGSLPSPSKTSAAGET